MQSRIILISFFILKCAILIPASWNIESEGNKAEIKYEDIQHKTKQLISPVFAPLQDTTLSKETEALVFSWVTNEKIPHPQFEKIEWRIEVPSNVQKSIDRWIKNNEKNTRQKPAINPFDPDEIDLTAMLEYTKDGKTFKQPIFGFYFREYERITRFHNPDSIPGMDDPNKWYWKEDPMGQSFRLRWAPEFAGVYEVTISLNVPSMGEWKMTPFTVAVTEGNLKNSFISVSENQHYFQTADSTAFMPVGLNLTEASFGCNCKEGVQTTDDCEVCYETGENDPCCGIHSNKKQRSGIPGLKLLDYTLATASYEKLEEMLKALSTAGANSFRTFFDPMTFDIEFEKLNNYYDRQYQAWEFDQMLDRCKELNLRIELNMQYHYSLTYHSYGYDRFDWDNQYNCQGCGVDTKTTGTNGWCYHAECKDTKDPLDFLTSPCAVKNYQKKIRYIISRWGYSSNIFIMELMSEINNIGSGSIWETNIDADGDGQKDDNVEHLFTSAYYADPAKGRAAVAYWHNEMARYIKEDLHHHNHLIAADYTGPAPMSVDFNKDGDCFDSEIGEVCNPCQYDYYDNSWHSPYIDVMAFSNYSGSLNRWEKMSVHEYSKNSQSDGLLCGWNDPRNREDDNKMNSPLGGYQSLWKPIIHAENALTSCMSDDHIGFVKDILADVFGGHASSGMSWDEWSSTKNWHYLGQVRSFVEDIVFAGMNPGKGNWKPNHSYSSRRGENSDTKFAEAIYMTNVQKNQCYGVLMNRSWNYYSMGEKSCITEERKNEFRGADEPLSKVRSIEAQVDRIQLKDTGNKRYTIRYYDPVTKTLLKEVEKKGRSGKLELENYPTMGDGNNGQQPFYFFTVSAK